MITSNLTRTGNKDTNQWVFYHQWMTSTPSPVLKVSSMSRLLYSMLGEVFILTASKAVCSFCPQQNDLHLKSARIMFIEFQHFCTRTWELFQQALHHSSMFLVKITVAQKNLNSSTVSAVDILHREQVWGFLVVHLINCDHGVSRISSNLYFIQHLHYCRPHVHMSNLPELVTELINFVARWNNMLSYQLCIFVKFWNWLKMVDNDHRNIWQTFNYWTWSPQEHNNTSGENRHCLLVKKSLTV